MNGIFTQIVLVLASKGLISLDAEYIDGTKIESKANKYTFVWRKSVEKNRAKLLKKIRILLEQIDDEVAQDNSKEEKEVEYTPELLTEIVGELKDSLSQDNKDKEEEKNKKKAVRELEKKAEKLKEYDNHLEIMGNRNSYSKTDHDATFMRMKEDAMMNGQTKPGYNLQIATENQFIIDFGLFSNPTDTLTLIPFFKSFFNRYGKLPKKSVADSGYGSEENYRIMDENGMEAYVKYNYFHKEHRPRYIPDSFKSENFFYNEKEDFCICPMGQHMQRIGTKKGKTESGYTTESGIYQAVYCDECPLRGMCFKASGNRTVLVNHRLKAYKKKASELLTSEEGIKERGRRCIEPEAVFGQIKSDMAYRRFRHFGKDKVNMDFAVFAIAFNLKKMCKKTA